MANDTVNPTITDSITQVNTEVVGMAPGVTISDLYSGTSNAVNMAMQNNTQSQHALNQIADASASVVVTMILKAGSKVMGS